ncbi:MAG: alpha/beta hydrolase [Anaerolineae bacterium]|nr:alpha/beta hydrolase [Anaerolineae bacterium]
MMQKTKVVGITKSDSMTRQAQRLGLILRILQLIGLVVLAAIIIAAVAFAWVRVVLLILALALTGMAVVGSIVQFRAVQGDRRRFPPSGSLIDVGGFKLHLMAEGEANGKPTVILESGMAGLGILWHWVQTDLAQETRVITYDRAGFGWSEVSPNPRTAQDCARELHTALSNARITGPYVLAGWSYGGLVVRAFADLYPNEVAGLTLVDASHPDQWLHMPIPNSNRLLARAMRIQGELCRFAFGRVVKGAAKLVSEGLPEYQGRAVEAFCALRNCFITESQQAALWNETSRLQVNNAKPLDNLPVYVLGVSEQPLYGEELTRLQEDLVNISANSVRTIVQGATHESLVAKREYAAQVSQAIRRVLHAAQTSTMLSDEQEGDH